LEAIESLSFVAFPILLEKSTFIKKRFFELSKKATSEVLYLKCEKSSFIRKKATFISEKSNSGF
jgi:hypothetical protein